MKGAKVIRESETVELKASLAELKAGLISMCAILNKHGAGELWFGIKNNGTVQGLTVTDKTLRDLSQAIAAHIEPKIFPHITREERAHKTCVKVICTGKSAPYFAYGRAYIHVAIFKDRVEIRSPGGLYDGLTIRKMRQGNVSKRRNPLIADLFRRIQMVEAWGRGMPLILENEPNAKFREIAKIFIASFDRPSFVEKTGGVGNETIPVEAQVEIRILQACATEALSSGGIAEVLGHRKLSGNIRKALPRLREKGLLEYTIPDKPNSRLQKYRLTDKGRKLLKNLKREG
jgi:predicted HTH transcriptional regulator